MFRLIENLLHCMVPIPCICTRCGVVRSKKCCQGITVRSSVTTPLPWMVTTKSIRISGHRDIQPGPQRATWQARCHSQQVSDMSPPRRIRRDSESKMQPEERPVEPYVLVTVRVKRGANVEAKWDCGKTTLRNQEFFQQTGEREELESFLSIVLDVRAQRSPLPRIGSNKD